MSRSIDPSALPGAAHRLRATWLAIVLGVCIATPAFAAGNTPSALAIGRPPTAAEVAAWNIDVRPDFQGLPKGSGSASNGADIFEAKCAACHGSFAESNSVFPPIAGGVTAKDIETGRVANLATPGYPQRTTLMKIDHVSTLWDFIRRAMPYPNPKSLAPDEVYAIVAYLLSLNGVVAEDFVLDQDNIAEVDKRMPNRNGMRHDHGMGRVDGTPDVKSVACMHDCIATPQVHSALPDSERGTNGNLADQNRLYGPLRGQGKPTPPEAAQ
ncbi:MAG: cytochrome c [Pseudomonadota bacterium]|nr:cytochrome c [Pseudomonadota bacterium]